MQQSVQNDVYNAQKKLKKVLWYEKWTKHACYKDPKKSGIK